MISLIIATQKEVDPGFSKSTLIGKPCLFRSFCGDWPRLIICQVTPLSVLSNWEEQIADHCVPGTLSTYIYYGTGRNLSAAQLQKHDVVITTYQTVAGEYEEGANGQNKKRKSDRTLFEVAWKVSWFPPQIGISSIARISEDYPWRRPQHSQSENQNG